MSTKVSVDNDIPLAPRKRGRPPKAKKSVETTPSKWRDKYKVHPAADVFPMMSDEKLAKLGQDIKANGLRQPIVILHGMLVDGRNRLEAMERAGLPTGPDDVPINVQYLSGARRINPVSLIISLNIHRRHLTKQQQADLIVAAIKAGEASRQVGEVPKRHLKGKEGSQKDRIKEAAVKAGAEHGIGKRTVERSLQDKEKAKAAAEKRKATAAEKRKASEVVDDGQKVSASEVVDDQLATQSHFRDGFMFRAREATEYAQYEDWFRYEVDGEMVEAAKDVIRAWDELVRYLHRLYDRKTASTEDKGANPAP